MSARYHTGVERTLLCATRFWSMTKTRNTATVPTLLQGVKHVVRKQGFSAAAINGAIKKLEAKGLITTGGVRSGKTIALTSQGGRVGCATVRLSPWTDDGYPGASLEGARKRRRKKHR